MRFLTLHASVSYLLAGLGLIALSLGSELPLVSVVLLGAGYFASLWAGPWLRNRPGYGSVWNGLLLTFLFLQVVRGFAFREPILTLGVEFAGFLQVSRLFHRRNARDHQHIQALAFLHLIAATVLSTGLEYAVVFFGFVLVTPWMLALTHLRTEVERHYGQSIDEPGPRVQRILASRRIVGPSFLVGTAALSLPLFLVTAAFFLLFPRVGMGFLSFGDAGGRRVAGFGGDVELGDFGVIRIDPTVVVRVRPTDGVAPRDGHYRLRGTSFDRYEGARWSRSEQLPQRWLPMLGFHVLQRQPGPGDRELEILLDPLEDTVLFVPDGTVALKIPPRVANAVDVPRRLQQRSGLDIRYLDEDGLPLRYLAYVSDDARGVLPDPLGAEELEGYLQLPALPPRVRALAIEKAGNGTPRERARRIESWLRESGEFAYSLEMPDTGDRDPLEVFLFEARSGHCEYFSTALAVMLRSIGIPARNVTGFVGGTWNSYGRYYAISQGDAHSWVEAWVDGAWETFDPTPASRGEVGLRADGWLAEVRALLDALRTRWSQDVVSYDLRRQVSGLRRLYGWLRAMRADSASQVDTTPRATSTSSPSPGLGLVVVVEMLALLGLLAVLWWLRRRGQPSERSQEVRRATRLYATLDAVLRSRGLPRPAGRTPKEHAVAVEEAGFEAADAVHELTDAYLAARYGGAELDLPRLKRRLREVHRAQRQ